jgi:hypothetical protein
MKNILTVHHCTAHSEVMSLEVNETVKIAYNLEYCLKSFKMAYLQTIAVLLFMYSYALQIGRVQKLVLEYSFL